MQKAKQRSGFGISAWKRVLAAASAIVMTGTLLPGGVISACAEEIHEQAVESGMTFPKELVDALQEECGDQYDAKEILLTLYHQGMINEYGETITRQLYTVNGVQMTEAQLREEAPKHAVDEACVMEGEEMCWGDVQMTLLYKDYITLLQDYVAGLKSGEIDMNDPERREMMNLLTYIQVVDFFL